MQWDSDNVNRIGMVLGFASFWLAAPEILGEQRLIVIEKAFEKFLYIMLLVVCLLFLPYTCYRVFRMLILFFFEKDQLFPPFIGDELLRFTAFYANASVLFLGSLVAQQFIIARKPNFLSTKGLRHISNLTKTMNILIRIMILITAIITIVSISLAPTSKIQAIIFLWVQIKPSILATIFLVLIVALGPRLIIMLADDAKARQRFLILGAVLFVLSFILQFSATFMTKVTP